MSRADDLQSLADSIAGFTQTGLTLPPGHVQALAHALEGYAADLRVLEHTNLANTPAVKKQIEEGPELVDFAARFNARRKQERAP